MNLLRNPEFEDTLFVPAVTSPDGYSTLRVPREWGGGVLTGLSPLRWINKVPQGAAGSRRVSGARSYQMYCEDGTFTAWLFQRVAVEAGTPLAAGAQAFIEGLAGACARVGIDPNGGENPYARGVVWSPWATALNKWTPRSVACTAEGEFATIFLYATQTNPTDPNGVYWDSAYVDGTPSYSGLPPVLNFQLTYNMKFRAGPGTQFDELARVPRGTTIVVTGRTSDGLWVRGEYNGAFGWLAAQYGTLNGDVMRLPVIRNG